MPDTSPILDLPYLLPAQAQKHVTHNAALERLDRLVQLRVGRFDARVPPPAPQPGEMHALGDAPTGAWAGQAQALAAWDGTAWQFLAPQPGWRAWGIEEGALRIWSGSAWDLPAARTDDLAGLGIGTGADATNRLSVRATATLLSHDGAGHQLKINKAGAAETASLLFQSGWAGHAEMGLAGDTDFAIKTSPDGANWTEALRLDAATGRASGAAVQSGPADTTPGRLMRADYGYGPGNLLGPVSQSGGTPAGAVIERGSNANGGYIRLADGTQICTHSLTLDEVALNGQRLKKTWTFPAAFSTCDYAAGTWDGNATNINPTFAEVLDPRVTNLVPGGAIIAIDSISTLFGGPDTATVRVIAMGRWF